MTDINFITEQSYGTCGFRSAHALHHVINNNFYSGYSESQFRLAFWNNILKFINTSCTIAVRDKMVEFTKKFDGFGSYSFDVWEAHITTYVGSDAVNAGNLSSVIDKKFDKPPTGDQTLYSIATTPDGLKAFLKLMGHTPADLALSGTTAPTEKCIVGWADKAPKWTDYSGLAHWTYVDESGTVYSWGKTYTYADFNKKLNPVMAIKVS